MPGSKIRSGVIAEGMTFVGIITAGDLEVCGKVEGEVHCSSLIVTSSGHIVGTIRANRIVVDGRVEGPIECDDIIFNSHANVVGNVHCQTVVVEKGAFIEGSMSQLPRDGAKLLLTDQKKELKEATGERRSTQHNTARADPNPSGELRIFFRSF